MDATASLRLLIVEDDPSTRANLRETLEMDGYHLDEAGSLAEAIDHLEWSPYLAVLIDQVLPDGRGEDLIPRLRERTPRPAPIVLTGHADLHGAIAAFRSGAADYLVKPIDLGTLRRQLEWIARQRQTEEALRETRERLRFIDESGLLGIATFLADGLIVDANDAFLGIVGHSREELASGQVRWDALTPPEWRARTREADAELEATGRARPYLKEFVRRDGRRLWGLFGGARPAGGREGVAFLLDVTEMRLAQERALQAERLAAIGEAMTGLIHEGRNALQRGQACLEMLSLHVVDDPAALDLIARCQSAQGHLHRLYEDIRGYAAPIHLVCHACDLGAIWRQVWGDLEPLREGRTATLREEVGGTDLGLFADPQRLAQVFHKLVENALAAAADPVEIVIRADPAELEGRPAVRVAVKDNGPGMDPKQRRRAFDPFYTTKAKGTGLGLAIARRIVEAHGGKLAIGEEPGPGTELQFTLPRAGP